MKKEVTIDDFINEDELAAMSSLERQIAEKVFLLNKQRLQGITDALDLLTEYKKKLNIE